MTYARKPRSSANFPSAWGRGLKLRWSLVVPVLLLASCGGAQSPSEQVRETATDLAEDGRAGRWGEYCSGTTDPDTCQQAVVDSVSIGLNPSSLFPSEEVVERMRVEVEGNRAVVDATAAEDAVYVRRDGRWLFVWGP